MQAVTPKEKLLIYNVKQGWKPLCEFFGCNIPDQEFPKENMTLLIVQGQDTARLQKLRRNILLSLAIFALLLSVVFLCV